MQSSRSFPCLSELLSASSYEKTHYERDTTFFNSLYGKWSKPTLRSGCRIIRRSSLPSKKFLCKRDEYGLKNQDSHIFFLDQKGRPMFRRYVRPRFLPYERISDKPLPILPVEEVEQILKEIESGAYSAMTTTVECEEGEKQDKTYNLETKLHCWTSMPEYITREVLASTPQLSLPDQPIPDSVSSETANIQSPISDFDFEIVQF
ncbi:unnamed protein product [Cylicocyclus nassatus]|uniref:Uncharacterized protein n=1 Tax=Cylicocyclus nassatus TaxID=53992 RepID=A0AA36DTW6_CYLNA|nr:unnamed protein product [Cylicocyclus nassatus]